LTKKRKIHNYNEQKISLLLSKTMVFDTAVLQAELAGLGLDGDIASAVTQAAQSKNKTNPLLEVVAALIEKDPVCANTGLARALRELSSTKPPPKDPTTWLSVRLRDYRPVHATVENAESVLDGLVMKCDEFANIHLLPTERPHPEAWNFRKCDDDDLPVFGVGQCHIDGIKYLLDHLRNDLGFDTVKWFNMREEPVVFLNGQACAPRTEGNMNENVEYLIGIEGYELDSMELRLCSDCVQVANGRDGHTIGVFYQTKDGGNEERQLTTQSKKTFSIRKGYEWLAEQENVPIVEYYRIPIADETAPEEKDFDQLIAELRGCLSSPGVALVFNCQMGRGRTTTGMVCACIMAKAVQSTSKVYVSPGKKDGRSSFMQRCKSMKANTAGRNSSSEQRNRKRGEFVSILSLMDLIDCACECTGRQAKSLADECIDSCAHAQNMVEAIEACEGMAAGAEIGAARSPEFWQSRAHNYLERYANIILFATYALENAECNFSMNFTEWSHQHWHFKRVIKHLTLD
jgi:hypothetical protein